MTVKFKIGRQSARAAKCDESFLGVFFAAALLRLQLYDAAS